MRVFSLQQPLCNNNIHSPNTGQIKFGSNKVFVTNSNYFSSLYYWLCVVLFDAENRTRKRKPGVHKRRSGITDIFISSFIPYDNFYIDFDLDK